MGSHQCSHLLKRRARDDAHDVSKLPMHCDSHGDPDLQVHSNTAPAQAEGQPQQPMQPPGRGRGPRPSAVAGGSGGLAVQAPRRLSSLVLLLGPLLAVSGAFHGHGGSSSRTPSRRLGVGAFLSVPVRWPSSAPSGTGHARGLAAAGEAGKRQRRSGLIECFVKRDGQQGANADEKQQQPSPSEPPSTLSEGQQRKRREAPLASRRDHLVTGGLLAGAMAATMLGARARADTTPMYMDRCVGVRDTDEKEPFYQFTA